MNTNQLKKFAQQTRRKLMEQVSAKLEYVLNTDSPELREKIEQVQKLKEILTKSTKEEVIDRVSYTWFNRFMALRFMDVNDYQPIGVKILTPKDGFTLPEILDEAKRGQIHSDLNLNRQKVYDLIDGKIPSKDSQNEAYKELLIASCNHLSSVFPFLFERINDYTELLLPDDLTSELSIIQDVRDGMTVEDCQEVEIIGWLYQFYISEKKDEVFASKKSVKKEDIPAATQLFTPRWIVEYMVQNTVGKLWLQNRPNSKLRDHMEYYIESPSSKSEDFLKLNSIEDLKLLDQACGSGHILVYGFDLLYKIYEEEGYNPTEIPELIITKNLHGFEIDERASQLSGMALMMKARSYHRRFFRKAVEPNILRYQDVVFTNDELDEVLKLTNSKSDELKYDLKTMSQATNFGSLIIPKTTETELQKVLETTNNILPKSDLFQRESLEKLKLAVEQLLPLSRKYHCIVDNPPYMGGGNMNKELGDFVKTNYPDSKADLMACFMEAGLKMLLPKGFLGMINQHSWMFLSSYENLRKKLIETTFFDTNLHLGARTFPEIGGEVVQNTSFTFWNNLKEEKGVYLRLVDFNSTEQKRNNTIEAIKNPKCGFLFTANQNDFLKIAGSNLGYWCNNSLFELFGQNKLLSDRISTKQGMATADNAQFLRFWQEVDVEKFQNNCTDLTLRMLNKKWFPYNKGGKFQKWYGNQELIINFDDNAFDILSKQGNNCPSRQLYFKKSITWTLLVSNTFGGRFVENHIFDVNGMSAFPNDEDLNYLLGLFNSKVSYFLLSVINPTLAFQKGNIDNLPLLFGQFDESNVSDNVEISKIAFNSNETSWDFLQNELIRVNGQDLEESYDLYQQYWKNKFFQLHKNEEELNRQFIEIYGLQEELTPDVPLEDITILKDETTIVNNQLVFKKEEIFAQFISYAVGCMFGRYSLDKEGLILANQGETLVDYLTKIGKEDSGFLPDEDNIIPILDDEWFEDDIVGKFHHFLKASFGKENFDKNLAFVEECLGKDIRKYFVKDFYNDHIKRYKKRPIYWMFSSPKGSFNVLIYMHRYTQDTLNKILNDYLIQYREKLNTRIEHLEHIKDTGSSTEQIRAEKEINRLKLIIMELVDYERDIFRPLAIDRIGLDLDYGVLVNYNKFGKAIKEVAGLNDTKTKKKVKEFDWIKTEEIR
ncbi:Eco57I restriction-modification methylase [Chryseobacterium taklimakanense]|uniref:site-specific DNA-methyltransferase (adenine-specific) n=1 Tax=Chryseobacterium taklimakanense TaxID=536441 RepID=A0A239X5C5_9FLAO|nr:BREX-1 system adenine-specific DNA-methyltransferase PglX [Chryseobacterium taklimakanense]SNV41610.1 Eco57I restriction-modification methylase [Chryseobacterium taklimakanense]